MQGAYFCELLFNGVTWNSYMLLCYDCTTLCSARYFHVPS